MDFATSKLDFVNFITKRLGTIEQGFVNSGERIDLSKDLEATLSKVSRVMINESE